MWQCDCDFWVIIYLYIVYHLQQSRHFIHIRKFCAVHVTMNHQMSWGYLGGQSGRWHGCRAVGFGVTETQNFSSRCSWVFMSTHSWLTLWIPVRAETHTIHNPSGSLRIPHNFQDNDDITASGEKPGVYNCSPVQGIQYSLVISHMHVSFLYVLVSIFIWVILVPVICLSLYFHTTQCVIIKKQGGTFLCKNTKSKYSHITGMFIVAASIFHTKLVHESQKCWTIYWVLYI